MCTKISLLTYTVHIIYIYIHNDSTMLNDCERNVHLAKLNSLSAKLMHFVFITAQVKQQWTKTPKICFLFINYEQLSGAQVVAKHWMEVICCGKGHILEIIWKYTFSKNEPCLLDFAKFQSPWIAPENNENKNKHDIRFSPSRASSSLTEISLRVAQQKHLWFHKTRSQRTQYPTCQVQWCHGNRVYH